MLRNCSRALVARGAVPLLEQASLSRYLAAKPAESKTSWGFNIEDVSSKVRNAEYAVRGALVKRAIEIQAELDKGAGSFPFKKLLYCNVGNPHSLKQKPMTYIRQVEVLCHYPELLDDPAVGGRFPADAVALARRYIKGMASTGAYTDSRGAMVLRSLIAEGIQRRDGYPADPNAIFLTDGASAIVHHMFKALIRDRNDCILTPTPQYPLYSAAIELYGGTLTPYYLNERDNWSLDVSELRSQVAAMKAQGKQVRGLVVIDPGNPTGQILSEKNKKEIIAFAHEAGVMLFADEVYQDNVYKDGATFVSFKKLVADMGLLDEVPLVSMMSASKGFYGECGKRGGFMELTGMSPAVIDEVYKLASINLSPNTSGQMTMATVMNPPQPGGPSWDTWVQERDAIQASFKRRSIGVTKILNSLEGVTCNNADGAMYVFPRIVFPPKFLAKCEASGEKPEMVYCMGLLEETGIVSVPGMGFGQEPGTNHFRLTFLPPEDEMDEVAERISAYHAGFMAKHR